MKIVVAGTGYVGLVTGVCLSEVGHSVTCVDINSEKIDLLNRGISPIYEKGLEELLRKNIEKNRLKFSCDSKDEYKNADVIFIGVGTPERPDGSANLDYVFQVCKDIASSVEKDCLVVVKSTVPIGTNGRVEEFMKENVKKGINIEVASNPEFLAQGTAVKDTLYASRIVIGTESKEAEKKLRKIYEKFGQPIVAINRKSAEMVKYASNDFLALKISYINEVANLCEIVGANIEDVTRGMGYDERIGNKFLKAGLGYGGSCFPKDTKALHWLAVDNGYEIKTIKAAIEVNENQKYKMFRRAKKQFGTFKNKKVVVLGLTFKPETDDLRESPSIPNIRRLIDESADIKVYDPVGMNNFKKIYSEDEIFYASSALEAITDAEIIFIFTEWNEIKNLKVEDFKKLTNNAVIFDGRNCFNPDNMREEGIVYYSVGR